MSTKSYLSTILIFLTILLFCFSSHAQSKSDTIQVIKSGMRFVYFKDNVMLSYHGLFFSTLGIGAVLIGISFALEKNASNKVKAGVDLFNQSIRQKNNTSLGLDVSPGGMLLRLNF